MWRFGRQKPAACIDLHTHSNASDGSDRPAELVDKAAALGLAALALTDHDTTDGLAEALERSKRYPLEFICGCELGATLEASETLLGKENELHILGLWVPPHSAKLQKELQNLRDRRHNRNEAIISKLNEMGINITYAEVLAIAAENSSSGQNLTASAAHPPTAPVYDSQSSAPKTQMSTSVGRPHIAEALHRKGVVSSARHAFTLYLSPGCPAYVPKARLSPVSAVSLLHSVGASVGLAHPLLLKAGRTSAFENWLNDLIATLRPHGLSMLEVYHSEHNAPGMRVLLRLAARHNLLPCGGSDYHGSYKPNVALGSGKNNLHIELALLEAIKNRRRTQGLEV